MGFPTDNYKGYVEADATHKAKNIHSDTFFLVHGLADATAPYQHGVQLARSLVDAGTLFKYTAYPDEGHELKGVTEHVYRSMEHFYRQCLSLDEELDDPQEQKPASSE